MANATRPSRSSTKRPTPGEAPDVLTDEHLHAQVSSLLEAVDRIGARFENLTVSVNEHTAGLETRVEELERLTSGIIDALGQLYSARAINDALANEDKDTPLRLRVPPIVLEQVEERRVEAIDLAERVWSFSREVSRLGEVLSVLADDESLPVNTTTRDPHAERLDALEKATGLGKLVDAEVFMESVLRGPNANLDLIDFRESLGASGASDSI